MNKNKKIFSFALHKFLIFISIADAQISITKFLINFP